jgi:hypothetical protein
MRREDLRRFADAFAPSRPRMNRVIVDQYGSFFAQRIRRMFPEVEVDVLRESADLVDAARDVAEAHVFVACHISALVLAMFVRTALLEVQPAGLGCTAFGSMWTQVHGAVYVPLMMDAMCDCHYANLSCYLEREPVWGKIYDSDLRHAMELALKGGRDQIG